MCILDTVETAWEITEQYWISRPNTPTQGQRNKNNLPRRLTKRVQFKSAWRLLARKTSDESQGHGVRNTVITNKNESKWAVSQSYMPRITIKFYIFIYKNKSSLCLAGNCIWIYVFIRDNFSRCLMVTTNFDILHLKSFPIIEEYFRMNKTKLLPLSQLNFIFLRQEKTFRQFKRFEKVLEMFSFYTTSIISNQISIFGLKALLTWVKPFLHHWLYTFSLTASE